MATDYGTFTWPSEGGSGGGVTSLNTLTGAVVLSAGTGITLTPSGNTITIAATDEPIGDYATSGSGDVSWAAPSPAGPVTTSLVATTNSTLATLSGLTTASSLVTVGTIGTGVWAGTTIAIAHGGTGQTSASAAFNALSPMTTGGDLIYGGASGAGTRLANGSAGQSLLSGGTTAPPTWGTPASATTATNLAGGLGGSIPYQSAAGTTAMLANGGLARFYRVRELRLLLNGSRQTQEL